MGASKAFVLSFTEAIIQEIKGTNVTMTAVLPPATDTDFFEKSGATDSVVYKKMINYEPKEVAEAACKALMADEDKVVPGFMNKIQTTVNNILQDEAVAALSKVFTKSTNDKGKEHTEHAASAKEREFINNQTGTAHGDLRT